MIGNILSLLVLVLLVVLFAWLAVRAWRARRAIVKWPGVILAGLLTLVFTAVDRGGRSRLRQAGGAPQQSGRRSQGRGHGRTGRARRPTGVGLRRLPLAGAGAAAGRQHGEYDFRWAAPGCALGAQSDARRAVEGLDGRRDRARASAKAWTTRAGRWSSCRRRRTATSATPMRRRWWPTCARSPRWIIRSRRAT